MDFINDNKWLKEIVAAVTPEDEKSTFLAVDYFEHFVGDRLDCVSDDWYGTWAVLFYSKNKTLPGLEHLFEWNSFEEAKEKLEHTYNSNFQCLQLKEGIKVAFNHLMIIDSNLSNDFQPEWGKKYDKWIEHKNTQE